MAEALYANGQFEEAERKSELAAASDYPLARDLGRSVLSKVRARQGRLEEAERLAKEAVASFDGTDLLVDHATALMALGEVLRLAGRMEEAASSVQQALDLFERKGDIVSAGKARSAIRDLTGENSS